MPGQMPQPEFKQNKPADIVNIIFTLASAMTGCVTPFLRTSFGTHAFGAYWLSAILMVFYAGAAECPLLAWYTIPWFVMLCYRRMTANPNEHSRYQGYPWVFGWMLNEYPARFAEVVICFIAATFVSDISVPLANFLLLQCVALMAVLMTELATYRARERILRDNEHMAREVMEMQRRRRR